MEDPFDSLLEYLETMNSVEVTSRQEQFSDVELAQSALSSKAAGEVPENLCGEGHSLNVFTDRDSRIDKLTSEDSQSVDGCDSSHVRVADCAGEPDQSLLVRKAPSMSPSMHAESLRMMDVSDSLGSMVPHERVEPQEQSADVFVWSSVPIATDNMHVTVEINPQSAHNELRSLSQGPNHTSESGLDGCSMSVELSNGDQNAENSTTVSNSSDESDDEDDEEPVIKIRRSSRIRQIEQQRKQGERVHSKNESKGKKSKAAKAGRSADVFEPGESVLETAVADAVNTSRVGRHDGGESSSRPWSMTSDSPPPLTLLAPHELIIDSMKKPIKKEIVCELFSAASDATSLTVPPTTAMPSLPVNAGSATVPSEGLKLKHRWLSRTGQETAGAYQPSPSTSSVEHKENWPPLPQFESISENIYLSEKYEYSKFIEPQHSGNFVPDNSLRGCTDDCINRLLAFECGSRCPCGEYCSNKRFQKKVWAAVEPFPAGGKGWGLRALEPIPKNGFIMEFNGEVLSMAQFRKRSRQYAKDSTHVHHHFLALNNHEIIDGTQKSNVGRFINHSCDPNAETQKWTVGGYTRLGFFARRYIAPGEEICFDYKYQRYGTIKQVCLCGSANCRGFLSNEEECSIDIDPTTNDKKRKELKRKQRAFDDALLDEKVDQLVAVGSLRTKDHVIKLCRSMLRIEDCAKRMQLLNVLRKTEENCLRLFLDYHGLPLLWCWLVDDSPEPWEQLQLRLTIVRLLKMMKIPHKGYLTRSNLLAMMQKWASPVDATTLNAPLGHVSGLSKLNRTTPSPNSGREIVSSEVKLLLDGLVTQVCQDCGSVDPFSNIPAEGSECPDGGSNEASESCTSRKSSENDEDTVSSSKESDSKLMQMQKELVLLATELYERWKDLREDNFRIPKLDEKAKALAANGQLSAAESSNGNTSMGIGGLLTHLRENTDAEMGTNSWSTPSTPEPPVSVLERRSSLDIGSKAPVQREESFRQQQPHLHHYRYHHDYRERPSRRSRSPPRRPRSPSSHKRSPSPRRRHHSRSPTRRDSRSGRWRSRSPIGRGRNCFRRTPSPDRRRERDRKRPHDDRERDRGRHFSPKLSKDERHREHDVHGDMVDRYSQEDMEFEDEELVVVDEEFENDRQKDETKGPRTPPLPSAVQSNAEWTAHLNYAGNAPGPSVPDASLMIRAMPSQPCMPPLSQPMAYPAVLVHDPNTGQYWWQDQTTGVLVYTADEERVRAVMAGDFSVVPHFFHNPITGLIHEVRLETQSAASPVPPAPGTPMQTTVNTTSEYTGGCLAPTGVPPPTSAAERNAGRDTGATESNNLSMMEQIAKLQQQVQDLQNRLLAKEAGSPPKEKKSSGSRDKPPPKLDDELPPEWRCAKDEDGTPYYYHIITKETQWEKPTRVKQEVPPPAAFELAHKSKQARNGSDADSEQSTRSIREKFKATVSKGVIDSLTPYRKVDCKVGRITNSDDFKYLARKLTHTIMEKELQACGGMDKLNTSEHVLKKAHEYIIKYMSKMGPEYVRRDQGHT